MAEPRIFASPDELADAVGERLGVSAWLRIDQERIDQFADATGDHQWIHTDPERAATGPFHGTIAHGYLTLALLPRLIPEVLRVEGARLAVNYGMNRVRFPAPVPVGSRVRATASVLDAQPVAGGWQLTLAVTVEREGGAKPVCVAETVTRYLV
ncbi:MaoC family dehydratase [Streptomyces profundus]|uniref:MaoC family dehydratase n=1 Tax=Streptomyces profundus TaxID=2867410 RepID=UPI001D16F523|nr:MaoC family dehydratase [Streptomyces sp. MA3_2.13]UED83378.1 MaoC family dehydratase [Streptomyces sp. MA3_2.13]